MNSWFDAHNHLQDARLAPHRAEIFAVLESLGIRGAVVNGTTEADWHEVSRLAENFSWVIPSYGLHPWFIMQRSENWQSLFLKKLDERPCAVGEIGLDRWMANYDFEDQQRVFEWQLAVAAERNLPVTIHCLKAFGALRKLIESSATPRCGFLLHAYGGSVEMATEFVKCGAYFSFSGYFLHERKAADREVFRAIPLERLLVETDAPSMPLPRERNRFPLPADAEGNPVNHPANIVAIYENLAELRGMSVAELAMAVSENFALLFGDVIKDGS